MSGHVVLSEWEVPPPVADYDTPPPPRRCRLVGWRVNEPSSHFALQVERVDCEGRPYWSSAVPDLVAVTVVCHRLQELGTFPTGEEAPE